MQIEEKESRPAVTPTEPVSEPLTPLANDEAQLADEDGSPDAIFLRAVTEIPTQPLSPRFTPQWEIERKVEHHFLFMIFLVVFCLLATAILRIINQPIVTVTLLPVHKPVQLTTTIPTQPGRLRLSLSSGH